MPEPTMDIPLLIGYFIACIFIFMLWQSAIALVGNMVKFRAQYLPKGVPPANGIVVTSYWGLLRRVAKLEGTSGLLRGTVSMWLGLFYALGNLVPADKISFLLPEHPAFGTLFWVISSPIVILMNRSLTVPEPLSYFNLSRMLDTLLTPDERARPWLLYFLPGFLPATLLEQAWNKLLLPRIQDAINPRVPHRRLRFGIFSISSLKLLGACFWLLHTAVSVPLTVILVRLALLDVGAMTSSAGEQVLSLRTGKPPYAGLWDCVVCIINEEGFGTFYRGWWLSFLITLLSGTSVMAPKVTEKDKDEKEKEFDVHNGATELNG